MLYSNNKMTPGFWRRRGCSAIAGLVQLAPGPPRHRVRSSASTSSEPGKPRPLPSFSPGPSWAQPLNRKSSPACLRGSRTSRINRGKQLDPETPFQGGLRRVDGAKEFARFMPFRNDSRFGQCIASNRRHPFAANSVQLPNKARKTPLPADMVVRTDRHRTP